MCSAAQLLFRHNVEGEPDGLHMEKHIESCVAVHLWLFCIFGCVSHERLAFFKLLAMLLGPCWVAVHRLRNAASKKHRLMNDSITEYDELGAEALAELKAGPQPYARGRL